MFKRISVRLPRRLKLLLSPYTQKVHTGDLSPRTSVRESSIQGQPIYEQSGVEESVLTPSYIEQLPNDLLLIVADFLDREHQILLSLTCTQLYSTLSYNLDLSLSDTLTKVRLRQHLEIDAPEYLTCRTCGLMFKWRSRASFSFECPRETFHSVAERRMLYPMVIHETHDCTVYLTREMVDLVSRFYERGPHAGISVSFFNFTETDSCGALWPFEARWIDGQLLIAAQRDIDIPTQREFEKKPWRTCAKLCTHDGPAVDAAWRAKKEDSSGRVTDLQEIEAFKCPFCATDIKVFVQNSLKTPRRVTAKAWRNYGGHEPRSRAIEQVFHYRPVMEIDKEMLASRDLQRLFEEGAKAGAVECESLKALLVDD